MKNLLYLYLLCFVNISYCQYSLNITYDDTPIKYSSSELNINLNPHKEVFEDTTYLFSNTKKLILLNELTNKSRYLIHLSDGNINNGYFISIVVQINNPNIIEIVSAFGSYSVDSNLEIHSSSIGINSEFENISEGSLIYGIDNNYTTNANITEYILGSKQQLDLSHPLHQSEKSITLINEVLSKSKVMSLNYSKVPHNILKDIILNAKIWMIEEIDELKLDSLITFNNNRISYFGVTNKNKDSYFLQWKSDISSLIELECDNYQFPNDCLQINMLLEEDYISIAENMNPLNLLTTKKNPIILPTAYFETDSLSWYHSTKILKNKNGLLKSKKKVNLFKKASLNKEVSNRNILNSKSYVTFQFKKNEQGGILPHGVISLVDSIEQSGFEGYYKEGLPDGIYHILDNGNVTEYGTYVKGEKQGWIHKNDRKGRINSSRYYSNGELNLDSLMIDYTYYNFTPVSIESPRSLITSKYDRASKKLIKKETYYDEVVFKASNEAKVEQYYFRDKNSIIHFNESFQTTYIVSLEEVFGTFFPNERDTQIIYKSRESNKLDGKFRIKCVTDESGKCRAGNSKYIKILELEGQDLKEEYDNGVYRKMQFDNNEKLIIKVSEDLESEFWRYFNAFGKTVSDILGGSDWSASTDTKGNYSFTVTPPGQTGSITVSSNDLYNYFNNPKVDLPYYESYMKDLTNEQIKEAFNDMSIFPEFKNFLETNIDELSLSNEVLSKQVNELLNFPEIADLYSLYLNIKANGITKKKTKFFIPEPYIPYHWGSIGMPTVTGEIRVSKKGNIQDFLAKRDNRSDPHGAYDLVATEGETIFAPVEGKVIKIGWPSSKDVGDEFVRTITIRDKNGTEVQLLYLTPNKNLKENITYVKKGEPIGVMPNMRIRFRGKPNETLRYRQDMINHIHMRIRLKDKTITDFPQIFHSK